MCQGRMLWGGWVDLTVIIGLVLVQLALYCKLEPNCQLALSLTKLLQYFNVKLKKKKSSAAASAELGTAKSQLMCFDKF